MTFEELDQRFPNGLYDSEIVSVNINYESRTAKLQLNLRGNPPDSPNRDEYQRALLRLNGFYYVVIEPPDADHLSYPHRSIQVNGYPEDVSQFPLFGDLKPKLSGGAFCCRFYVHDWNSFIHIAATDAQFSWVEDGTRPKSAVSDS